MTAHNDHFLRHFLFSVVEDLEDDGFGVQNDATEWLHDACI